MKILYVTTISNTVNSFLIPHIKLLVEKGHHVDVAFNVVEEVKKELIKLDCKVYNIGFQRSPLNKSNYTAYKELKSLIKTHKYELVHTHTPVASACVRIACRQLKDVKVLYTAHGFHFYKGAPLKNWLLFYPIERFLSRFTDGIITMNSEDFNHALKMKLKKPDSVHFTNGVGIKLEDFKEHSLESKTNLRKEYDFKDSDFIMIYVGALSHRKNQHLLIKSMNLLKHKLPNLILLLAGSGPLESELKDQVDKLELNKAIKFLGYREDISNLMTLSDLAVSSSRQEGLPVNIMEAMSSGLPLVVTNCRGNRDLVTHNENGFVIKGNQNAKSFANSIVRLYESKKLRQEFGIRNMKRVSTYAIDNILTEIKKIYSQYELE